MYVQPWQCTLSRDLFVQITVLDRMRTTTEGWRDVFALVLDLVVMHVNHQVMNTVDSYCLSYAILCSQYSIERIKRTETDR